MTRPTGTGRALLGIDLGTSSVKAVLTDLDGTPVGRASGEYPVVRPRPGWSETDPGEWLAATRDAVRAACGRSGVTPVAIGLSGQMHGLVPTDPAGRPTRNAMLWSDGRAVASLEVYRRLPERVAARLANPLSPGMAGPMLAWLAEHETRVHAATRWALQPKDWLRLRLTGRAATEPSDASATLLYDIPGDGWDLDVLHALDIDPERLAPLLPGSGHRAGELTAEAARLLDLPEGLPVAAGAADAAAAALGSGLADPDAVQLTLGTGAQVVRPVTTLPPELPARPVTHLYRAAADRGWYVMGAGLNGGSTLAWVLGTLGATWAELYATSADDPRPDDPLFLPHLHGERTPYLDPELRGGWTGLAPHHDRRSLLRAALEGVAFGVRDALDAVVAPDGPAPVPRLAGGGTTDPAWRHMLSDVLGLPLAAVDVAGASGLGAAALAASAAGIERPPPAAEPVLVAEPDTGRHAVYNDRYHRFRGTITAVREQRSLGSGA
jgi:xylulokinase